MSTWMILRVPIWQRYYSGVPECCERDSRIGPTSNCRGVNSRNACRFESLFCARDLHPPPACVVHLVGSLRCSADSLAPGSSLAAYRFTCLGDSYGTASLAVSFNCARELA